MRSRELTVWATAILGQRSNVLNRIIPYEGFHPPPIFTALPTKVVRDILQNYNCCDGGLPRLDYLRVHVYVQASGIFLE